jgi:hypothetical protein
VGGGAKLARRKETPPALRRYVARIDSAIAAAGPDGLSGRRLLLARASRDLEESIVETPGADTMDKTLYYTRGIELSDQLAHLNEAAWNLARVVFDATVDDDRVVPGQPLRWSLSLWNASTIPHSVQMMVTQCIPLAECHGPERNPDRALAPSQARSDTVEFAVLDDQPLTMPYFLRSPRDGDLYTWPKHASSHVIGPLPDGDPFDWPDFVGSSELTEGPADSAEAASWSEAVFRFNDQARGEVRRPVMVVPRIDVKLDPTTEVWPTSSLTPHGFTVTLTHGARDTTSGSVRLQLPRGWPPVIPQHFRFTHEDERGTFVFEVHPPARLTPDSLEFRAVAQDSAGSTYDVGVYTVDYPHIRPRSYTRLATTTVRTAPLALPRLARVGYVRGAADRVPEALLDVGVPVSLLSGIALERGNLDRYDAIIVGPRAYETDSALVENNGRLLAYARRGGLVIVQYQQHQFFNGRFAPYPMTVGGQPLRLEEAPARSGSAPARAAPPVSHDRVTDESAPVRVVAPDHPVVRAPNRISRTDWTGWVQERGLYFARSWDRHYRPVFETHDPGEAPLLGGLLVAPVGKGTYVYTGLSFFRQLPAGVPGAFRLFANLLALGRK